MTSKKDTLDKIAEKLIGEEVEMTEAELSEDEIEKGEQFGYRK